MKGKDSTGLDELNIKEIAYIDDPSDLVAYQIKPNFRLLGPKFGKRMPLLAKALAALPAREVAARARATDAGDYPLPGDSWLGAAPPVR